MKNLTNLGSAILLSVTLALILSGCVTAPVKEPLRYQYTGATNHSQKSVNTDYENSRASADTCSIYIERIEDSRKSKSSFGSSPYFRKFAESVPDWTWDGFHYLSSENYRAHFEDEYGTQIDPQITMHVQIHKAYVLYQPGAKSANLAISVHYTTKDNLTETKLYRGRYTAINWSNSASEIEGAMNEALSDVLTKIDKDISQYCLG